MTTCFEAFVPIVGLRPYTARDYQESLPLPPPATILGMCMSVLGCERDLAPAFSGTHIAVAGRSSEKRSTIIRRMRRGKERPTGPSFRPEYQELLLDLSIWFLVARGDAKRDLGAELSAGLRAPARIVRHGVVSLGESPFMVDVLKEVDQCPEGVDVLRPSRDGDLTMPVWVDHGDRSRTRVRRFSVVTGTLTEADLVAVGPGVEVE